MKLIAKSLLLIGVIGAIVAHAQTTLLVDNFTTDSGLNALLWTTSSAFLTALASASSSPPASFVTPQLSFNRQLGMSLTGPTGNYQTTGVQSLSTFTPPFSVLTYVIATEGTANPFEIFLASSDLSQFLTVAANVSPTYHGMWATAPNVSQLWQLGEQFSPGFDPIFDAPYKIIISVDAQGLATARVGNFADTSLGSVAQLQAGTEPFYLVLGQRIGNAPPASQVGDWFYVRVTTP